MATEVLTKGRVSRVLPQADVDGGRDGEPTRLSRYGEQVVLAHTATKHTLAEEGSYFVTTTPTPGTAVAYGSAGTQTSFSDTVGFMVLQNLASPADPFAKSLFVDYIKLIQIGGTAPATTTSVQAAVKLDAALRTETAGTMTAALPGNVNGSLRQIGSVASLRYATGAVSTIPAATSAARVVGRAQLKGGPTLVLDEHTITFGAVDQANGGGYLTTVSSYHTRMPPVVIPPGWSMVLHVWFPGGATNPFTYEFEMGHWER